jgi:hypothetical protein
MPLNSIAQHLARGRDDQRGLGPLRDDAEPAGQRLVGAGELVDPAEDHVDEQREQEGVVDEPEREAGEELGDHAGAARLQRSHHRRGDRLRHRAVDPRRPHHGDRLEHRGECHAVAGARPAGQRRAGQRDAAAEREEELQRGSGAAREKRHRGHVGQ